MDFKNAKELLEICEREQRSISEVMRQRECDLGEIPGDMADHKMNQVLEVMRNAAHQPLKNPAKSMGGLIGGEARKLSDHAARGKSICGEVLERAIPMRLRFLRLTLRWDS